MRMYKNTNRFILFLIALCILVSLAVAQRRQRKPSMDLPPVREDAIPKADEKLSGRITFTRIRFDMDLDYGYRPILGDGGPPWSHDYPVAGRHFVKILAELSKADVTLDVNEPIVKFDDPALFKFPFAYLCEVNAMVLSDKEIKGLREYLLRGGFLMVDDFRGMDGLLNLQEHLQRALPEYKLKKLESSHPVFNCFFSIDPDTVKSNEGRAYRDFGPMYPEFWGLEDQTGRLMLVANLNYDASDYWQFSNDPFKPIEETNEAYKFGVNYIMYALTH